MTRTSHPSIPRQKVGVTLPVVQIQQAREKAARELGFSLPELIRHFIASYLLEDKVISSHREQIAETAEKRYLKELKKFYKQQKTNPQSPVHSAEELIARLDQV